MFFITFIFIVFTIQMNLLNSLSVNHIHTVIYSEVELTNFIQCMLLMLCDSCLSYFGRCSRMMSDRIDELAKNGEISSWIMKNE